MTSTPPQSTPSVTFLSLLQCMQYHPKPLTPFRSTRSERIVNPCGHRIFEDCYTTTWPSNTRILSQAVADASSNGVSSLSKPILDFGDEELLARFTRGFFGGRVFVPERFLLVNAGLGKKFGAQFEADVRPLQKGSDLGYKQCLEQEQGLDVLNLQSPSEIPTTRLLPVGSKIYGTFQVLDSHLVETTDTQPQGIKGTIRTRTETVAKIPSYSYIDVGFGSGSFAGCHRFSIHHQGQNLGQHQQLTESSQSGQVSKTVTFTLAHFTCNPVNETENLPPAKYLYWFHQLYAKLLFADALRGVMGHYC